MSIKTDNTSAGSSGSEQFRLPLKSTGTYNFNVFWGDGTSDSITAWNQTEKTHTYPGSGTYEVRIFGVCDHIYFNSVGSEDVLKLLDITQWGDVVVASMNHSYKSCLNLVGTWTDFPVFSGGVATGISFNNAFSGCSALSNTVFPSWTMGDLGDCTQMFKDCTSLNVNIGSWDITGFNIDLTLFMDNTALTTVNYDAILIAFAAQGVTVPTGNTFDVGSTQYTIATSGSSRATLVGAPGSWTINDGGGI